MTLNVFCDDFLHFPSTLNSVISALDLIWI